MKFIDGLPMNPATKRLAGVVVEVLRRADLLEQAVAHHRDPGAHRHRLDLVVGDVDERRAQPLVEAGDLGPGLDAELGVEVRERLVHEEHGRLADDRPAERDALALAAGQLLRLAVEELLEARGSPAASLTRFSMSALGSLRSFSPNAMLSRTVMCG